MQGRYTARLLKAPNIARRRLGMHKISPVN